MHARMRAEPTRDPYRKIKPPQTPLAASGWMMATEPLLRGKFRCTAIHKTGEGQEAGELRPVMSFGGKEVVLRKSGALVIKIINAPAGSFTRGGSYVLKGRVESGSAGVGRVVRPTPTSTGDDST